MSTTQQTILAVLKKAEDVAVYDVKYGERSCESAAHNVSAQRESLEQYENNERHARAELGKRRKTLAEIQAAIAELTGCPTPNRDGGAA